MMKTLLIQFLHKSFLGLSAYASDPQDDNDTRLKKVTGILAMFVAILLYWGYGFTYFWVKEQGAALICLGTSALIALGLLTYWKVRRFFWHANYWFIVSTIGLSSLHMILGGFIQSGMVIVWLMPFPYVALFLFKPGVSLSWLLTTTITVAALWILYPFYFKPENNFSQLGLALLATANMMGFGAYAYLFQYYFVWQNQVLTQMIKNEQVKTENLLLNILPQEIAAILKNENRVIADQFEDASILFADVVNFTPMSASMSPTELVELLNDVYSHFDAFVEKYNLEKIKTIGDCYMVAAGVPRRRTDHALVLAQLALDLRDFVSQHEFCGRYLQFRIGINSGPVVAGVIGRKKFAYDLWGDAVNTASRMESHGSGGFIQITEDTYKLIKNDFNCEARGKVNVKGKGEINVWYVVDKLR